MRSTNCDHLCACLEALGDSGGWDWDWKRPELDEAVIFDESGANLEEPSRWAHPIAVARASKSLPPPFLPVDLAS